MYMKQFLSFWVLLLSFAGAQTTVKAQGFEPVEGELYVLNDGVRFVVDNPDHHCTKFEGHPDLLTWVYDAGSYHGLFYIAGNSVSGYTIRPASRPESYVYVACDDDSYISSYNASVGVKAVNGEPGDECKWFFTKDESGDSWKIAPIIKQDKYWNNYFSACSSSLYHPEFSSYGSSFVIEPLSAYKKKSSSNPSYAETVDTEVEKLKQQGVNATTWASFEKATDEALALTLPAKGWYRIKSLAPVEEEEGMSLPYLYSNTETSARYRDYTALGNRLMTPEDGRYIWQVATNDGLATITGSSGKGINLYRYADKEYKDFRLVKHEEANQPTAYSILCGDYDKDKELALYYGFRLSTYGQISSTDWALKESVYADDDFARFEFERVEESGLPGSAYLVEVCAPKDSLPQIQVDYVGIESFAGNHCVGNGGYFFLNTVPEAQDFQATAMEGYRHAVVVDGNHITVSYVKSDSKGEFFRIGKRVETPESGKTYAIFNTSSNIEGTSASDCMVLLYAEEGNDKMLDAKLLPYPGALVPAQYAWTLTQGAAPDLWNIRSVATQKYAGWDENGNVTVSWDNGENTDMRVTEWTSTHPDWREVNVKSMNDDGSFTPNSKISEANHVWTIGRTDNGMFWNENRWNGFATWQRAHPFAFYELQESTFPDAIADVKAGGRQQGTGLFDLQGRRVRKAGRGIYIQNGRKFVVK